MNDQQWWRIVKVWLAVLGLAWVVGAVLWATGHLLAIAILAAGVVIVGFVIIVAVSIVLIRRTRHPRMIQ